jgi:hypothetical protein
MSAREAVRDHAAHLARQSSIVLVIRRVSHSRLTSEPSQIDESLMIFAWLLSSMAFIPRGTSPESFVHS